MYKRIANAIRAKDSLSLNQLEKMLKQLPSCIFLKDTEGRYVFSTQIWHHLDTEGDPNWTIRGKTDLEIRKDKDNARKAMEADRRILETGQGTEYIIEENQDGIQDYLQLIKRPVFDENGKISGIIALINNITDYQLLKLELEKRAKTDALTGLLNKDYFYRYVSRLDHLYKGTPLDAVVCDINRFHSANKQYGRQFGDRVLRCIGNNIKKIERETGGIGCRQGGD